VDSNRVSAPLPSGALADPGNARACPQNLSPAAIVEGYRGSPTITAPITNDGKEPMMHALSKPRTILATAIAFAALAVAGLWLAGRGQADAPTPE
jgi:hypothetical protein